MIDNFLFFSEDYENIIIWSEKLNPDYLSKKTSTFTTDDGREVKLASNKEKYYNWLSKSYQEVEDYDMCLEVSKKALEELTSFTNNSDVWFKWRIARSLREIGEYGEAIEYLKDIYKTKKDWFIRWELAENYFFEGDHEKSLEYAVSAALSHGDSDKKIKLYSLLEDLLEDDDPEIALKHSYLIYSIQKYIPIQDFTKVSQTINQQTTAIQTELKKRNIPSEAVTNPHKESTSPHTAPQGKPASSEEEWVLQIAPEIIQSYRNIQKDHQLILQIIKEAQNQSELEVLHGINMKRFRDILEGYLKIKQSPKDYYNADARLEQAQKALEQFDLDLDETLRRLNESQLQDFEISLRMMHARQTDKELFTDQPK